MQGFNSIAAGMLCLALAGSASAIPVDFRDASFSAGYGVNHFEHSAASYDFTFDALHISGMQHDGTLYWDAADGFGIIGAGWEDDEIEFPEVLSLSFGETVYVDHLIVTDLFIEQEGTRPERGFYSLDGGSSWNPFTADGLDDNGEMVVAIDATASQMLLTSAGRDTRARRNGHEFSLAGIDLYRDGGGGMGSAAPEPSAALLFGVGALVIRSRSRRA